MTLSKYFGFDEKIWNYRWIDSNDQDFLDKLKSYEVPVA